MTRLSFLLLCTLPWPTFLRAQDPAKASSDLRYSEELGRYHLVAWVSLETEPGKFCNYQFDRYADQRRIKEEDGTTYAQIKNKPWRKSEDWGETGPPASTDKVKALETESRIPLTVFAKPETNDPNQGGFVWRMIERQQEGSCEYFTYERTREHPRPGVYSRFTFGKYQSSKDGKLTLYRFGGRLRDGDKSLPLNIRFDYMIPLPPGTKVGFSSPRPEGRKR